MKSVKKNENQNIFTFFSMFIFMFSFVKPGFCAEIFRKGNEIHIIGKINSDDDEKFKTLLKDGMLQSVVINSPGGKIWPAITIASIIHDKDLELHLWSMCGSACAQIILPAANKIHVDDNTIILVHAGDPGMIRAAEKLEKFNTDRFLALRKLLHSDMTRLDTFERVCDKPDFFRKMSDITGYSDLDIEMEKDASGNWKWHVKNPVYNKAGQWIPSYQSLRELGIPVNNWRPPSGLVVTLVTWRWPWELNFD